MRHLKTYRMFENYSDMNTEEILKDFGVKNYSIRPDGAVDVNGSVNMSNRGLTEIPVRFGRVTKNFLCYGNRLISLMGAPAEVGVAFVCSNNRLASLEGAPEQVGGDFDCSDNRLASLEGAPVEVGADFMCSNNLLTSLEGAPERVGWGFNCDGNRLTTLEGAPEKVSGSFSCDGNRLTDLVGAPEKVSEDLYCSDNLLTSLEGAPEKVNGGSYFQGNPVPPETLRRIYEVMLSKDIGYGAALEILYDSGELLKLDGFEKLDGIDVFPDLRGRSMGSKLGI